MKSFFASLAVVACLATTAFSQQFTINSLSSVVVCQPSLITWVGGQAPYFLGFIDLLFSILPAGQPSAPALIDLGQQNGNSVTWLANLGVGTSGFLNLRDSTGALAQSGQFTVAPGSNITCVGQTVSASQGPAATPAPSSASPAASGAATTPGGTAIVKPSASVSGSSAAKPTSGAMSKYAGAGVAAVIGSAIISLIV